MKCKWCGGGDNVCKHCFKNNLRMNMAKQIAEQPKTKAVIRDLAKE